MMNENSLEIANKLIYIDECYKQYSNNRSCPKELLAIRYKIVLTWKQRINIRKQT